MGNRYGPRAIRFQGRTARIFTNLCLQHFRNLLFPFSKLQRCDTDLIITFASFGPFSNIVWLKYLTNWEYLLQSFRYSVLNSWNTVASDLFFFFLLQLNKVYELTGQYLSNFYWSKSVRRSTKEKYLIKIQVFQQIRQNYLNISNYPSALKTLIDNLIKNLNENILEP